MFKWKGIDFADKGIVVEHYPTISKAEKRITTYTVEGRNGFLSVDKGTYEPFSLSVECHCKDSADKDDIKEFLDGYGTISLDNEREYTGIINSAIEFEKVQMFKSFKVQFLVNPIAEDITATSQTISASPTTVEIVGANTIMYPTLIIEGSGSISITINNSTFYLTANGTYTLDCKNKEIVDANGNNSSSLMNGDFPTLKNGTNTISYTGTITSFTVTYKKAYL